MNKFLLFFKLLIVGFVCVSCASENDKRLRQLFEEIKVESSLVERATCLIIIPGYGCSRCIARANAEIHASLDTIYIMVCRSDKDFRLMTGKRKEELSNVYLDKGEVAMKMKLVKTIPLIYTLKHGKIVSCEPFLEQSDKEMISHAAQTTVEVDKAMVDWGNIPFEAEQQTTFVLTNTGKKDLYLTDIILSCECMHLEYAKRPVLPGDTLHLHVTFHPDAADEFIREMYIYGNFTSSPRELKMKGYVLK